MNILDVAISSINFLSLNEKVLLRKKLDSLDSLAVMSKEDISSIIKRPVRASFDGRETSKLARLSWNIMESNGIQGILYDQEDYPRLLKEIQNPPYMLFYRGNISCLNRQCVSVVGTRQIVPEVAKATFEFAKAAASSGITVVSGLANGVDFYAHKGAIASGEEMCTCGVLPCGIDTIVPVGHKNMVRQILGQNGVYLSEYIPGCPAEAWRFVQRNRIIAALSSATVVTQAPYGSGALLTVDFAIEENRDVMFHESCFCEDAKRIAEKVALKLQKGPPSKAVKLQKSPEKYLEDGASLIKGFEEYLQVINDEPGTHICIKTKQLTLGFD